MTRLLPLVLLLVLVAGGAALAQADDFQMWDRIYYKGNADPVEGKILEKRPDGYLFQKRGGSKPIIIALADVERVVPAELPERVYEERARKAGPGAEARMELANFCWKYKDQARPLERLAEVEAFKALKADPKYLEAYQLLSQILRERYKLVAPEFHADVRNRELEVYERAQAALGTLPPSLALAKVKLLRDLGMNEAALGELIAVDSSEGGATGELRVQGGDIALALERYEFASEWYEKAAQENPSNARALVGMALASFGAGRTDEARQAIDRALEASPGAAEALTVKLALAIHGGDLKAAEDAYATLTQSGRPTEEIAMYGAFAAALQGKIVAAKERAALAGSGPEAQLAIGFIAEVAGDPSTAISAYVSATEKTAALPGAGALAGLGSLARAHAFLARGDADLAEEALRDAAKRGYDFGETARLIARARRLRSDFKTAVRFARYAADSATPTADLLYELGLSYLGAEATAEAEAQFDAALLEDAQHAPSLCGKARILHSRGEYAQAEELLLRAVRADRSSSYAGRALERFDEARNRRLWRDDFERPDSRDVRNRWVEEERFGVDAAIRGGRLVLSGIQASEDYGRTQIVREVDRQQFAELRARFELAKAGRARVGMRLWTREAEIVFFRDADEKLKYAIRSGGKWADPKEVAPLPSPEAPHELWMKIGGPARDQIIFGRDDIELGAAKIPAFGKTTSFSCAIGCQAPIGASVEAIVDEARLFVVREKKVTGTGGY
jgi:tetratricopeptide (TPR) repeat protein